MTILLYCTPLLGYLRHDDLLKTYFILRIISSCCLACHISIFQLSKFVIDTTYTRTFFSICRLLQYKTSFTCQEYEILRVLVIDQNPG